MKSPAGALALFAVLGLGACDNATDGHIRVDQQGVVNPDGRFDMYQEGSMWFAVVRTRDGSDVVESPAGLTGRFEHVALLDADIPPGAYVVETYQRPCDGSCESLGPISDRCALDLTIEPDSVVLLRYPFSPGHGCSLTVV